MKYSTAAAPELVIVVYITCDFQTPSDLRALVGLLSEVLLSRANSNSRREERLEAQQS
jgi:hypothetical protein